VRRRKVSEQKELASDLCESSENPRDTKLQAQEGGTPISCRSEADEEKELLAEEEAEILERLRVLGYL
jgi:hypothetical protein